IADVGPWAGAIAELDFRRALDNLLPQAEIEETRVLSCPNCGAQVEYREEVHAKECPFCATPVVTDTGTHRHIKPKGILPFALSEDAARDAMTDWLGSLWFAPNGLTQYARKGRRLQGIYVPYWTFDADTRTRYTGARGTVRSTGTGKNRRRTTSWRNVSGRVARLFDDVLVLASQSLPRR
ncbi:MAG: primosomal protein N' (replication factor Y) - superfamily II helicase, partial [Pseudomonadota bacterium]